MEPTETRSGRDRRRSRWMATLLEALRDSLDGAPPVQVVAAGEDHNNDLFEIRLGDGRILMAKRAAHDWAAPRFEASRIASRMLRRQADVITPVHLDPPDGVTNRPLEIYWKVPLPTLADLWPEIASDERPAVLREWGGLLRRTHEVRLPGFGALPGLAEANGSLGEYLRYDLAERLLPAVRSIWPDGRRSVQRLVAAIDRIAPAADARGARLVHNDLHMGNVLCERRAGRVRCVGLIDFEAAAAGPPETDLASAAVLHGPSFGQRLDRGWFEHLRDGYGDRLLAGALLFFRGYHLVNMGFYSALVDRPDHAHNVARLARATVERLESAALANA